MIPAHTKAPLLPHPRSPLYHSRLPPVHQMTLCIFMPGDNKVSMSLEPLVAKGWKDENPVIALYSFIKEAAPIRPLDISQHPH